MAVLLPRCEVSPLTHQRHTSLDATGYLIDATCGAPAAQKGEAHPGFAHHCNIRHQKWNMPCTHRQTSACCSPCRVGTEHDPTPLASRPVHLRVGDFTCGINPPALGFTFPCGSHLSGWLETPIATVPLRAPLPGSAPFMPEPPRSAYVPLCDRPMRNHQRRELRIVSVITASASAPASVFRFHSLPRLTQTMPLQRHTRPNLMAGPTSTAITTCERFEPAVCSPQRMSMSCRGKPPVEATITALPPLHAVGWERHEPPARCGAPQLRCPVCDHHVPCHLDRRWDAVCPAPAGFPGYLDLSLEKTWENSVCPAEI